DTLASMQAAFDQGGYHLVATCMCRITTNGTTAGPIPERDNWLNALWDSGVNLLIGGGTSDWQQSTGGPTYTLPRLVGMSSQPGGNSSSAYGYRDVKTLDHELLPVSIRNQASVNLAASTPQAWHVAPESFY